MGYKCAKVIMRKIFVVFAVIASIFAAGAAEFLSNELSIKAEANCIVASSGIVIRQNTVVFCREIKAELYLYTNGTFKLITGDEALKGTYNIEDGVNLVLSAEGYRDTYGKIYFNGAIVSRVELGERRYYPGR